MMRKFTRLSDKINKRGYNFDPKRKMFGQGEIPRAKLATIVEKRVTSLQIAPSRTKERKKARTSIAMIRAMMKKMSWRSRTRNMGRRAMRRRPSSSQRRKETPREASWWKNKNRWPMSHQVKNQVMKKTSSPLLSQMKNHCYLHLLCASWQKVT